MVEKKFRNKLTLHITKNLDELMDQMIEALNAHARYHIKSDAFRALGPKAKNEIMRGQWDRELKDVKLLKLLKQFEETFLPTRNVFHIRAQFFYVKKEKAETMDDDWKRFVNIERECEFNQTLPLQNHYIQFRCHNKRQKRLIKGPLELRTVLESIDVDNYNRKYGDKNQKKRGESPLTAHLTENKLPSQSQHGIKNWLTPTRRKLPLLRKIKLDTGTFMSSTESTR